MWVSFPQYGGIISFIKCLVSTIKLHFKGVIRNTSKRKLEVLTFSVLPGLTKHWLDNINALSYFNNVPITVGDCSGGMNIKFDQTNTRCIPFLNLSHGKKLDIFINKVCESDLVLICDDDIFFIESSSVDYALQQFDKDPKLAVVSLFPRPDSKKRIKEYSQIYPNKKIVSNINNLIGSYCLIIRKKIWVEERLSFQQVKPENWREVGNFFDTCDFANYKLIELGYNIKIIPKLLKKNLIIFTSLSLWGLRIKHSKGRIDNVIRDRPDEYEKAYQTALTIFYLQKLIKHPENFRKVALIDTSFILKTLKQCELKLKPDILNEINQSVKTKINRLRITKAQIIN